MSSCRPRFSPSPERESGHGWHPARLPNQSPVRERERGKGGGRERGVRKRTYNRLEKAGGGGLPWRRNRPKNPSQETCFKKRSRHKDEGATGRTVLKLARNVVKQQREELEADAENPQSHKDLTITGCLQSASSSPATCYCGRAEQMFNPLKESQGNSQQSRFIHLGSTGDSPPTDPSPGRVSLQQLTAATDHRTPGSASHLRLRIWIMFNVSGWNTNEGTRCIESFTLNHMCQSSL